MLFTQARSDRLRGDIFLPHDCVDSLHNLQGEGHLRRGSGERPRGTGPALHMGGFLQHEKVS